MMKTLYFEEIDSTSAYLKRNNNLENMTFVYASFQTNGKGREDRVWYSPKNENLMFSFIINNKDIVNKYKAVSIFSACVIRDYLEAQGLKNVTIKWPNDVYVNDKKICGILLEGQLPNYLVVGIGINVNQSEFNDEYRISPTSIKKELGINVDLDSFRKGLFKLIEKEMNTFNENNYDLIAKFNSNNYLYNKKVSINNIVGIAKEMDEDYNLLIETEKGIEKVFTGEISF